MAGLDQQMVFGGPLEKHKTFDNPIRKVEGCIHLLSSNLLTRTIDALRIDLPLAALFNAPTVADMALAVTVALVNGSAMNQSEAHFNV